MLVSANCNTATVLSNGDPALGRWTNATNYVFNVQAYNDERQRHALLLCDLRNCQWQYQRSGGETKMEQIYIYIYIFPQSGFCYESSPVLIATNSSSRCTMVWDKSLGCARSVCDVGRNHARTCCMLGRMPRQLQNMFHVRSLAADDGQIRLIACSSSLDESVRCVSRQHRTYSSTFRLQILFI